MFVISVVPRLLLEAAQTKEREAAAQAALSLLSSRNSSRKSSGQGLDSDNLINASGKGGSLLDRVSSAISGKSYLDLSNHANENKLLDRVSSALSGKSYYDTSNNNKDNNQTSNNNNSSRITTAANNNNNNNNHSNSTKTPHVGGTSNNHSFRNNSVRAVSARLGDADPPDIHPSTHHAPHHHALSHHPPTHHDPRDQRRPSHLPPHLPHQPTHGDDKETTHKVHQHHDKSLFSVQATHHTLPIFASGSAFVPTAMDTILSNWCVILYLMLFTYIEILFIFLTKLIRSKCYHKHDLTLILPHLRLFVSFIFFYNVHHLGLTEIQQSINPIKPHQFFRSHGAIDV